MISGAVMSIPTPLSYRYVKPQGPAEAAIRLLVSRPSDGSRLPTATAKDRMDNDLVQLSDRTDAVLSQYGDDTSLANLRRDLTGQISASGLASVGRGRPNETRAPTTRTTQQTLADDSVRSTTVAQTEQTIEHSQTISGGVVTGGQTITTTARTITAVGGNNVTTGAPLADTNRRERTTSKVVTDIPAGVRTETFNSAAIVTTSNSNNVRAETVSRVSETKAITNASGRFIQRVVNEDYQSVTTSREGVVQGAEFRSSRTVTLVNLDTGEVTRTSQTASNVVTAKTETSGTGANATTVQTISVRTDLRDVTARAGGANDVTEVAETASTEVATLQQTTRDGLTTQKLSTAASTASSVFTGVDKMVLTASRSAKNESTSLDSSGAYSATSSQRETQFAQAGVVICFPEDSGRVPVNPDRAGATVVTCFPEGSGGVPVTPILSASSLFRSASVSVAPSGRANISATEESQRTQAGQITPALSTRLSITLPAPIGAPVSPPAISTTTANGKLAVQPLTGGRFNVNAFNTANKGSVVSVNQAALQLKAVDNAASSGPSANVNGLSGALSAAARSGGNGVSGVLKADEQSTTIVTKNTRVTNGGTVSLKADGAGNFSVQQNAGGAFVAVRPLNLTV
jgi:hypothetical protein